MAEIQFGSVQKMKLIEIAMRLIVICNCMPAFCVYIVDDEYCRVDFEYVASREQ
jgi:hypothetical protein